MQTLSPKMIYPRKSISVWWNSHVFNLV
jgi:hypothetical protein